MQLRPGVRRTRQATAAKASGRHAKITSVFLHKHVGRDFRRAKEGVLRLVDAHVLGDALLVFVPGLDFPTRWQFLQRQAVRRVTVNLVRRSKNEGRFRAEISRRFKEIEGAVGIDCKVHLRIARCPVVRRLRRAVHNRRQAPAVLLEKSIHGGGIADVDLVMLIVRHVRQQLVARPAGGGFLSEKPLPHVVVDSDNRAAIRREAPNRFRANQSRGTRNQNGARLCHFVRQRSRRSSRSVVHRAD